MMGVCKDIIISYLDVCFCLETKCFMFQFSYGSRENVEQIRGLIISADKVQVCVV